MLTCQKCGKAYTRRGTKQRQVTKFCSIKCCSESQPHYRGGISKENNPSQFSRGQRQRIWRRDNAQCRVCRSSGKLVVHHRTFKKDITTDENLILLCRVCHMAVHYGKLLIEQV